MPLSILAMTALFIVYLAVQLLFCFKAKKSAVKLIPVFASVVLALLLALMYFGVFGQWSAGILGNGQELVAGFLLIVFGVGFIGDIIAWAIWFACIKLKK